MQAAIPDLQTNVDGLGNLLGAAALPPPPAPGGGPTTPSSDCSQRTNQYGLSQQGTVPGVTQCDWRLVFQVLRVQDGPCTYRAAPAAGVGATGIPQIISFTLAIGDTNVWSVFKDTQTASDGTVYDVIAVKITPTQPGHYDALAGLHITEPDRQWNVCLSVDFIP